MRIHVGRLVLAPVAQEIIELLEAGLIVPVATLEDDCGLLVGMDIEKSDRAVTRSGFGIVHGSRKKHGSGQKGRGHRHFQTSAAAAEPAAIALHFIHVTSQLASASLPEMGSPVTSSLRQQS